MSSFLDTTKNWRTLKNMLLASVAFKQAGKSRARKIFNCGENISLISREFDGKNTEANWEKMDKLVMKDIRARLHKLTGGKKEKLKIVNVAQGGYNEVGVFKNKKGEARFAWRKMLDPITVVTINFTDSDSDTDDSDSYNVEAKEELENQYKEYRLSCKLSKEEIAPKIVGLANASIITSSENRTEKHTKLYQIMETYDGDVYELLKDIRIYDDEKKLMETLQNQLMKLFISLSKLNIICGDLKPLNSVYRFKDDDNLEVKLIDWGVDFCIQEHHTSKYSLKIKSRSMMILYSLAAQVESHPLNEPLFGYVINRFLKINDNLKMVSTFLLETFLPHGRTMAQMAYHYYGDEDDLFEPPPSYEDWNKSTKGDKREFVENIQNVLERVYISVF